MITPTVSNTNIPDWLKPHMQTICPHCGVLLMDDGPDGKLTQRMCINPACPGHMAQKIDLLAKRFKVSGVGPATAEDMIRYYKFKSHLEALPIWFKEKPIVELWEVGDLAMIYGMSGVWKEYTRGYKSMSDMYAHKVPAILDQYKDYLLYAESFFITSPPLSRNVINVMMTGSIEGFTSRSDFIRMINETIGTVVQVQDVGKRKTGVHYLIKEEFTVDHSKTALANEAGIPIVTSKQFLGIISHIASYITGERSELNSVS